MGFKNDIVMFLRTDPMIAKINFEMCGRRVYPGAYRKDVADAFDKEAIKIKTGGASPGAGATYDMAYDTFEVAASFAISNPNSRGFVIHESTHAHLDIQNFGHQSAAEAEAIGYLAEAIFMEACGFAPISTHPIRVVARPIAQKVLGGLYKVPPTDSGVMVLEVIKEPHYAGKAAYPSNGFARSWVQNLLR